MNLVFDTLDGREVQFDRETCRLVRTGTASDIPAAAHSDPLVLIRAFEEVVRRVAPRHPGVIGSWIDSVILRSAAGTNDCKFAVTYKGPPQLPKPQSRWVVEDSATLCSEVESLDITPKKNTLQTIYAPPGNQAGNVANVNEFGNLVSGGGLTYPPIADSVELNVLRPRRTLSITGWIIGRPGEVALNALGCVNDRTWYGGYPIGYWLCTHVFAKNENAARTPFPDALMLYHVGGIFQSKMRRDWSHYAVHRNLHHKIPKDLANDPKRAAVMAKRYDIEQDHGANGFLKVGMYPLANFEGAFGF